MGGIAGRIPSCPIMKALAAIMWPRPKGAPCMPGKAPGKPMKPGGIPGRIPGRMPAHRGAQPPQAHLHPCQLESALVQTCAQSAQMSRLLPATEAGWPPSFTKDGG